MFGASGLPSACPCAILQCESARWRAEYPGAGMRVHTLPQKRAAHGSAVRSISPRPPSSTVALRRASAKAKVPARNEVISETGALSRCHAPCRAPCPPRRPPLHRGSGGLDLPLYVYRLSCLRIEGEVLVDARREERLRPPAHAAAASGDGEERFADMSTCASLFRDAVRSNACCLDSGWLAVDILAIY